MNSAAAMRDEAARLLRAAPASVRLPFDDGKRRWIEYRPEPRPGVAFGEMDADGRKASHRLLATALRPHAFAQAMGVVALEEVLDRKEGYGRHRHSNDYRVLVFGEPDPAGRWGWRFEGHHISITMTLDGDTVSPTPVFLGANPLATYYRGHPVLRPLGPEHDLGFAVLDALPDTLRPRVVREASAPVDIYSGPHADVVPPPPGVPAAELPAAARERLDDLVGLYLDRLPADVAFPVDRDALTFTWEGPTAPGTRHYYRIQGPDLLIEYDNTTADGNHAHTVLRRPESDFGGDILRAHRTAHPH
ncbi:DUF3500 domain-containing protein [Dactylosporangium matsuzakiense]|uniref:DUF3500 domain-containing protein n=2 Tax=Dactylosporangium matsuzakiense TaxID=53360 RepID=A0A9W6KRW2_9ACTN|nr:hypothetical protein GCM10017581_087720 [Dactylosporangium matsuzakiense]